MSKRLPKTRRKIPKYFDGHHELAIRWNEGWEVGFYCSQLKRWDWLSLTAERIGKKLETEANVAACRLMRESAVRWEAEAAKANAVAKRLSVAASGIESGRLDWSAV